MDTKKTRKFYELLCIVSSVLLLVGLMEAQTISLDGKWDFAVDSLGQFTAEDVGTKAQWHKAIVPMSWQAQFEDLRDYQGVAWYRRKINLPKPDISKAYLLQFGAVDYFTEVFLNGKSLGKHEGGYTPFEFDLQGKGVEGENEILVRVLDPAGTEQGTEGVSYWHIPHGKQSWYVQTSGIWQSVKFQSKTKRNIASLQIDVKHSGELLVKATFNVPKGDMKKGGVWPIATRVRISDPNGIAIIDHAVTVFSITPSIELPLIVVDPKEWSTELPQLYICELVYGVDTVRHGFGFRSFESRDGKFYLNGEPFYVIAALDQDFYPNTISTTPSEEYLRDEMLKAKKLGLNTLRCHIKVPDPLYLKVADEVGLVVWYEIPNWDVFTPEAGKRGLETFDAMLERDWNHPSLCIISLINESWGLDLQKEEQRKWLKDAFNHAKQKATGRLIVDNSACWGNFHIKTDINDYHTYWAIPEKRQKFTETIADMSKRPDWLFSKFGDAEETKKEPLVLSEFGNWGLPKIPKPHPWWLNRPFGDAFVANPEDFEKRFQEFGYDKIFGTYDRLAEESQHAQFAALKWEIEEIRRHSELQGYCITEFTDIHWESNGLLDMWRNFKVYSDELPLIQQPDVIIPRPEQYSVWANESTKVDLWLSHYSGMIRDGATLEWSASTGQTDVVTVPTTKNASVVQLSSINVKTGNASAATKLRVDFVLRSNGKEISKNFLDLFVYPRKPAKDTAVLIGNSFSDDKWQKIQDGASAILLVDSTTKPPQSFPFTIAKRDTAAWLDGNWASNFNWMNNLKNPFNQVLFSPRLGFEAASTMPEYVVAGLKPENFNDVLAGMFVGWLHLSSGYVVQMQVGKGRLILCTFPLNGNNDPFAVSLLSELVSYIQQPEGKPTLTWNP